MKTLLYASNFPANSVAVELTKGFYTLIDVGDLQAVSRASWHHTRPCKRSKAEYAYANNKAVSAPAAGKTALTSLHKYLFRCWGIETDGLDIDHINGDGLDNRRANLRLVTRSANRLNSYSHRAFNDNGVRVGQMTGRPRKAA